MGNVGATKTEESNGFVPMAPALEQELRAYASRAGIVDRLIPSSSEAGTPYDPKNYLNRKLKPLAKVAKVPGVNFQVLRRMCDSLSELRKNQGRTGASSVTRTPQ